MNQRVLVTGSSGLVGSALVSALISRGFEVCCLDLRALAEAQGDVCDRERLRGPVSSVDGVVHLAAVSRVGAAERNPELCWATNVGGLRNVLELAAEASRSPWVIFASSREVYGHPERLPVTEDFPLRPVNVYGHSKAMGERLVEDARRAGLRACIVRLSNVYGSAKDHEDRVIPAFMRAAAAGRELRIDGAHRVFDFTHVDDVTRGILALIELLGAGKAAPPPIQLVSGKPTTLGELAQLVVNLYQSRSAIREAPPRTFDVSGFIGAPLRAKQLLGWVPRVQLEEGLTRLVGEFRRELPRASFQEIGR